MQFIKRSFVIFSLVMLSLVIAPFTVSAQNVGGSSPIIGVNVKYYDIDKETYVNSGVINLDQEAGRWTCKSYGSSGACSIYQSGDVSGNSSIEIDGTIDFTVLTNTVYLYEYEFILDGNYVGSVTFSNSMTGTPQTSVKTYFVNGNSFTVTSQSLITSFTVSSYDLRRYQDDVYTFPVESFPMVYYCLSQGFTATDLLGYGYYQYPMFETNTTGYISAFQADPNSDMFVILWSDRPINKSNATSYLTWSSDYTLKSAEMLAYAPGNRTVKLTFHNNSSSAVRLDLKWVIEGRAWFPIYQWYVQDEYVVTTDFAMLYGLNNSYLNMIEALKPTTQSDQSASDLQDEQNDFSQSADDLFQYEDDFNDTMNDSLDQINVNFNVGNQLGSKFLASADWVRSQFNTLTNNTPFGTVLSFSLILGLALLLIGKAVR